jgi:2-polyprenyl-6-methoxyphenol hydroxylase-like FAD-dependent oxidoreductase
LEDAEALARALANAGSDREVRAALKVYAAERAHRTTHLQWIAAVSQLLASDLFRHSPVGCKLRDAVLQAANALPLSPARAAFGWAIGAALRPGSPALQRMIDKAKTVGLLR